MFPTGLILGAADDRAAAMDAPQGWRGYLATGHLPDGAAAEFIFRAITPRGRPRRFDARFLMVTEDHLSSDPDDFSRAEDELSHLQWIPLREARGFDLPFITEVVLAEIESRTGDRNPPESVPFFKNNDEASLFLRLRGYPMPDTP